MSSKARTLTKGSILRITEFFAVAIVTLMMTPFVLRSLGDSMYGLWIFIGSFLGYYGLMDLGLSSAVQRFLSRAIGTSDTQESNKIINTALVIYAVIGFMVFVLSVVIATVFPAVIKNITDVVVFRKAVIILGVSMALGFPFHVFSGILAANLRYDLGVIVEIAKLIVRTILIILFLINGFGIIALALITLITDVGGHIARYIIVRRLYKKILFSWKLFEASRIKSLFGYSVYAFVAKIADQLKFNIDSLVIISFIGLGSLTI